ncbi:hypothetical protein WUBG_12614 [Wuchereria bancrofti]|uniref:Eukaryotic translation initiation factor 3 subunit G N-terminal domain-containing protein n=1 Tax=Wuchereria bancrofti TaxID=6293 RepID=J9E2L4_WUCBA|nr:hypothetical protein WUBG_12614 [Wuchereria bancrofti]
MGRLKESLRVSNVYEQDMRQVIAKKGKLLCFHCKGPHNTALCPLSYKELTQTVDSNKENWIRSQSLILLPKREFKGRSEPYY